MSDLKHTPGPWRASKNLTPGWFTVTEDKNSNVGICTVAGEANAKLIAAAPELLRVLKQVRCAMDASDNIDANGTITQQFGEFFVKEISKAINLATS